MGRYRMTKISSLFTILLLFASLSSAMADFTEEDELEIFLQAIQNSSDQVRSFSSDFTQEKILTLFTKPIFFYGKLFIVRPDRLRWEFTSPVASILILNGDEGVRCYDQAVPAKFQLSADPVMKMVARQLWLWLGGDYKRLGQLYKLQKLTGSILKIIPEDKETADFITSVTIVFDEKSLQPLKVEIMEPGGDLTRISFHSSVINGPLPEKLFTTCKPHE